MDNAAGNASSVGDGGGEEASDPVLEAQLKQLHNASYGVVLPAILLFGSVGNALNLLVFARARFTPVTYTYLRALAASDLAAMLLLWVLTARLGWNFPMTSYAAAFYLAHVELVVVNMFLVASALLVLAITLDRFVSVCYPLKARFLVTHPRAKAAICACFVLPALLYIPYGFIYNVKASLDPESNHTIYEKKVNLALYENDLFQGLYKWSRVSLFKIIPIILVISLNSCTMFKFREITKKRAAMTSGKSKIDGEVGGSSEERRKLREDKRLMILLGCVALMYVVCLTPMAILFLTEHPSLRKTLGFNVFNTLANLLEVFNSAMNFYIYCLGSKDFRKQFRIAIHMGRPQDFESTMSVVDGGKSMSATGDSIGKERVATAKNGKSVKHGKHGGRLGIVGVVMKSKPTKPIQVATSKSTVIVGLGQSGGASTAGHGKDSDDDSGLE